MSEIPQTMRAAVLYDVHDIRLEERPVPLPGPGELLVRMGASGVCSGDLMPWYVRKKAPFVFGHEPAGTIVAIGAGAEAMNGGGDRFSRGDRVFVHHHAPCLHCERCRRGAFVQCPQWRAATLDPGGMAEYFRVTCTTDVLPLPKTLAFADGSLVEPLACVVKSLRRAARSLEAASAARETTSFAAPFAALHGRVLYVIGLGVMGLLHVALARAAGATVFGSDFLPARRSLAEELGATATFHPGEAAAEIGRVTCGGADVVICGPGSTAALTHAAESVGPDGTVMLFTPIEPTERFLFDQSAAYFRDVRLVSSYSCGPDDTRIALDALNRSLISAAALGSVAYSLDQVGEAYAAMAAGQIVKPIVLGE